jgi:hypothetical protein
MLLYGLLKYAAYSFWCWIGLRAFRPEREPRLGLSLGLGALRLGLGLSLGFGIWLASTAAAMVLKNQLLVYLAVYVPVRWIEWAVIDALIGPKPGAADFLLGASWERRGWRARGILLSCLADLPMIVDIGGLPLGRFMC